MLSICIHSIKNIQETNVEIYVFVSALIYVILHYIIFNMNNEYVKRFKYIFYGIVMFDIIYAYNVFKKKKEIVKHIPEIPIPKEVEPKEQPKPQPHMMIIEKPYIDNESPNNRYVPYSGDMNILPHPNIDTRIKDQKMEEMNKLIQSKNQQEMFNQAQQMINQEEIDKLKEKVEFNPLPVMSMIRTNINEEPKEENKEEEKVNEEKEENNKETKEENKEKIEDEKEETEDEKEIELEADEELDD